MDFKLEDNIPVAPIAREVAAVKYPFADMKPGQSFLVPVEIADTIKGDAEKREAFKEGARTLSNRLTGAVRRFRDRPGHENKAFAVRAVPEQGGVRVWYTGTKDDAPAPAKKAPSAKAKGK